MVNSLSRFLMAPAEQGGFGVKEKEYERGEVARLISAVSHCNSQLEKLGSKFAKANLVWIAIFVVWMMWTVR